VISPEFNWRRTEIASKGETRAASYVKNAEAVTRDWLQAGKWQVEIVWRRYPANVRLQSFYFPAAIISSTLF